MGAIERYYKIDQLLSGRKFISRAELQERLGVSWATLKRDLAYMKDRLNAPVIFDRDLGGYRFDEPTRVGPQYELPGLWFTSSEIHALLTMQHLLANLDKGGLLGPHIQPLLARLTGILGTTDSPSTEIQNRIKILTVGARQYNLDHFQALGTALLQRKQLMIHYHSKGKNEVTERQVSPQRLVHYRDNWYMDGWCHLRNELRSFSVDSIRQAAMLESKAKHISKKQLDEVLGSGYGIFSGTDVQWATLRFTPDRARWVAGEAWHRHQKSKWLDDGRYELEVPYSNDHELLMDILKYGADIEVIAPTSLVERVKKSLQNALKQYV